MRSSGARHSVAVIRSRTGSLIGLVELWLGHRGSRRSARDEPEVRFWVYRRCSAIREGTVGGCREGAGIWRRRSLASARASAPSRCAGCVAVTGCERCLCGDPCTVLWSLVLVGSLAIAWAVVALAAPGWPAGIILAGWTLVGVTRAADRVRSLLTGCPATGRGAGRSTVGKRLRPEP